MYCVLSTEQMQKKNTSNDNDDDNGLMKGNSIMFLNLWIAERELWW